MRFPPRPDHVREPGAAAAVPPVGDLVGRREHERRGLGALLPAGGPRVDVKVSSRCVC